jgi:uncharacterized protein YbcI
MSSNGSVALQISNALTRLYRENFGRGPTSARTVIDRNYVAVLLSDIYTPMERTLIDAGRADAVRQARSAFQEAKRDEYKRIVEEIVGAPVVAFLSEIHVDPDLALEAFVLAEDGAAT